MGPVMGKTLLEQEGDEHRASRALVSPLFRAKLLERWRIELVEVVVHDGTLDVVRTGAKRPFSYASGEWTDVEGDQKRFKKRFWG